MSWVLGIVGAIFVILIVIIVHELGHFSVAKLLGFKVLRFSIGFGKPLLFYKSKQNTEYVLAALPLGGYVKMLNREELANYPNLDALCYEDQPVWKQMLVTLAGPVSNFLFAIVLFWLLFMLGTAYIKPVIGEILPHSAAAEAGLLSGDEIKKLDNRPIYGWGDISMQLLGAIGNQQPIKVMIDRNNHAQEYLLSARNLVVKTRDFDPLEAIGLVPFQPSAPAKIEAIVADSPAMKAGLQVGDVIRGINDKSIDTWYQAQRMIQAAPLHQPLKLEVESLGKSRVVTVQLEIKEVSGKRVGFMGIQFRVPPIQKNMVLSRNENVLSAWRPAVIEVENMIILNAKVLVNMFRGKIGLVGLSGPVGILQSASTATHEGFKVYVSFIAIISVALGFLNLLPFPVLDGGHFVLQVIQLITRRPVPQSVQQVFWKIGIIILIMLFLYATLNDIQHIFLKT